MEITYEEDLRILSPAIQIYLKLNSFNSFDT